MPFRFVSTSAPASPPAKAIPFHVATGCLSGDYDGVFISTDLEPDDALALAFLAPKLRGVPLLCVVGEGPVDKREMMANLLASFGIDSLAVVLQGKTSAVPFPSGVAESYHDAARPHACTLREGGDDAVAKAIDEFLTRHDNPFALLLKPPHELVATAAPLLAKTKAILYGSFNLTCLREVINAEAGGSLDEAALHERQFSLMAKFGNILWIERSLSVGRDSVLEPRSCPPAIARTFAANPDRQWHTWLRRMAARVAAVPTNFINVD